MHLPWQITVANYARNSTKPNKVYKEHFLIWKCMLRLERLVHGRLWLCICFFYSFKNVPNKKKKKRSKYHCRSELYINHLLTLTVGNFPITWLNSNWRPNKEQPTWLSSSFLNQHLGRTSWHRSTEDNAPLACKLRAGSDGHNQSPNSLCP